MKVFPKELESTYYTSWKSVKKGKNKKVYYGKLYMQYLSIGRSLTKSKLSTNVVELEVDEDRILGGAPLLWIDKETLNNLQKG